MYTSELTDEEYYAVELVKEKLHLPPFSIGDEVLVYSVSCDGVAGTVSGFNRAGRMLVKFLEIQIDPDDGQKFSAILVHPKQCRPKDS
jgi:hypothetical protein